MNQQGGYSNEGFKNDVDKKSTIVDDADTNFAIKQTIFKRAFFWICGIETSIKKKNTEEAELDQAKIIEISIEETPFWAAVNKINLVFQLCVCGFLWVFFNKF